MRIGVVVAAEVLVLGISAMVVLVITSDLVFGMDSLSFAGSVTRGTDAYVKSFFFVILGSGLVLIAAAIAAAPRLGRLAMAVPPIWFIVIVSAAVVAAAVIGEQPCVSVD